MVNSASEAGTDITDLIKQIMVERVNSEECFISTLLSAVVREKKMLYRGETTGD